MRQLRALLAVLALALGLPSGARADIGLSAELRLAGRPAAAGAQRPAAAVSVPPRGPLHLVALGGDAHAIAAPAGGTPRQARARTPIEDLRADHSFPLLAAHSRSRAARLGFLRFGPSLAVAIKGVVGFHTSPAPPLA